MALHTYIGSNISVNLFQKYVKVRERLKSNFLRLTSILIRFRSNLNYLLNLIQSNREPFWPCQTKKLEISKLIKVEIANPPVKVCLHKFYLYQTNARERDKVETATNLKWKQMVALHFTLQFPVFRSFFQMTQF
jgi:hypothetical protein